MSSNLHSVLAVCLLCASLLVLAVSPAGADVTAYNDLCAATIYGSSYDLSALRGVEFRGVGSVGNQFWDFYLNLCGVTNATAECADKGAMACAVPPAADRNASHQAYAVAKPYPKASYSWMASPSGVTLIASGGECPFYPVASTTFIQVMCAPMIVVPITGLAWGVEVDPEACTFTLTIMHALGCPLAYPADPTSNDDSGKTTAIRVAIGLGVALAVVLSVLLIVAVVYCAKRCCCNSGKDGANERILNGGGMYSNGAPSSAPAPLHGYNTANV